MLPELAEGSLWELVVLWLLALRLGLWAWIPLSWLEQLISPEGGQPVELPRPQC